MSSFDVKYVLTQSIPCLSGTLPIKTMEQVRARQLWGTNIYTDDSDIVAVLMHTGYYSNSASSPPATVKEFVAVVRPVQARGGFASESRYNIRSRAWGGAGSGCGYRVESCSVTTKSGNCIHLEPCTSTMPSAIPTFIPAATERVVNTRSSAASLERKQRFVQEVTIQYNLCNEPWLKYSMATIADRGLKRHQWTSSRLKKEVMYLESTSTRYELSWARSVTESGAEQDFYRWSKCKRPLALKVLRQRGIPLPGDDVEHIVDDLDWEELKWAPSGVQVKGQKFQIARVQFLQRTCLTEDEGNSD